MATDVETRRERKAAAPAVATVNKLEIRGSKALLCGEFDAHDLKSLRAFLCAIIDDSTHPVFVDLGGVTFLGLECAMELVVWPLLHPERLVLCNLSCQAGFSFAACGSGVRDILQEIVGQAPSEVPS